MALEQHNTALDFETMLRRHLSRGGSVVEACMGFDADTANAYLENALGASARSNYDSHLAGCPSCRRHVIELSRLMQLPLPNSQPIPVVSPSIWSHWKSVVAEWGEWLGLSNWQQGWATAGAAAAILIGVVSIQLWRQQANQSEAQSPIVAGKAGEQIPQPSPTESIVAQNFVANESDRQSALKSVPRPDASPMVIGGQNMTSNGNLFAGNSLTERVGQPFSVTIPPLPPQVQPGSTALISSTIDRSKMAAPVAMTVADSTAPAPPAAEIERSENVVVSQIGPSPSDNPMAKKPKEPKGDKASPSVFDKAFSFLPTRKSADARKLEEKEIEPDAPKLLAIRRRDKVFNYQSGFWVDSAYKPEMAWRVTKVVLGSEEYKQLLATEPLLKEYFASGQAIVIWKDKIYKVVAK